MWQFAKYVFSSRVNVEGDLANPVVWNVRVAARSVKREAHRMKAFLRFKLTKDELYYAIVEPESNVLPLISFHFQSRYADQRWLIYDAKQKYGIYYALQKVIFLKYNSIKVRLHLRLLRKYQMKEKSFFRIYGADISVRSTSKPERI